MMVATTSFSWGQTVSTSGQSSAPAGQRSVSSDNVSGQAAKSASELPNDGELPPGEDPENRLLSPFIEHLVNDQRQFWTSPLHLRVDDLRWIAPGLGVTAAFIATDSWWAKQVPLSHMATSKTFSEYGTYSFLGLSGASFLLGHITRDDHLSEAGLLAGEAAINSTAVAYAFKAITERQRPDQGNGHGDFFVGGSSFPSEHSAIAWSVASVWAHEYPGWFSQIAAYGLASTVTITRVTAKQHFPTDALIGSALGWYFGRQVYRSHHDPELGGTAWGSVFEEKTGEKSRNPNYMASPYVPLDSWIYPALERLIGLGYIHSGILGIRPWTRMASAQMIEEAGEKLASPDYADDEASRVYRELSSEFAPETSRLDGNRNLGGGVDSIYTRVMEISGSPLRDGYHFAQTVVNDYGRPFGEGINLIAGASASAEAGPVAFYARGEYQQAPSVFPISAAQLQALEAVDFLPQNLPDYSANTGSFNRFQLLEGAVSVNLNSIQVSFGKQSAWLGPGESGSLLFSDNAAPIPMVKIDSTTPYEIPLLSNLLGPVRSEFFLGRLDGQQWIDSPPTLYGPNPSDQPFVHGDKISFKPTENFEFGMGITSVFGGSGLPVTFNEFFKSYYSHKANLAQNPAKRFSAADFTYRVPGLRNWLTVYGDSLVVDEVSPIGSTRASVNPGIFLPQLPKLPKVNLRAEFFHVSNTQEFSPGFVYTDRRYTSGYTNDGFLLGSWIGRAGEGGQAWATYQFSPRNRLQFGYRAQRVYQRFLQGGSLNDFSVKFDGNLRRGLEVTALAQYENWRFSLLDPSLKTNFTSSIQLTYWPRWGKP
jgi:membrane-associated phospholipid phosphatase